MQMIKTLPIKKKTDNLDKKNEETSRLHNKGWKNYTFLTQVKKLEWLHYLTSNKVHFRTKNIKSNSKGNFTIMKSVKKM